MYAEERLKTEIVREALDGAKATKAQRQDAYIERYNRTVKYDCLNQISFIASMKSEIMLLSGSGCIITNAHIRRSEDSLPGKRWPLRPDSTFGSDGKWGDYQMP